MFKTNEKTLKTTGYKLQNELEEYFLKDIKEKYKFLEKSCKNEHDKYFHSEMLNHDKILASYFSCLVVDYLKEKAK